MSKKIKISREEYHNTSVNVLSDLVKNNEKVSDFTTTLVARIGSKVCSRLERELFGGTSMKTKAIKIKFFNDTYEGKNAIKVADKKCNWIDLRASEAVFIPQGSFRLIPLGVAMQLPEGYEALIVPRSSTFKNWGIIETNSMGVIDETYCGDNDQWFFPAYCLEPTCCIEGVMGTSIHKGDRICQFRIIKHQPNIEFNEVDFLNNDDRGGHGSTGTN